MPFDLTPDQPATTVRRLPIPGYRREADYQAVRAVLIDGWRTPPELRDYRDSVKALKRVLWANHGMVARRIMVEPAAFLGWDRSQGIVCDALALTAYCDAVMAAK